MTFNAMTERYEEITVCGKPALFTSIRIKRDTVPDGLYAYDVRHDDECRGIPCEIAPFVILDQVLFVNLPEFSHLEGGNFAAVQKTQQ